MTYLLNKSKNDFSLELTKNPMTNSRQSPNPTVHPDLKQLDPEDPKDTLKIKEIKEHPNYSEVEKVTLKQGVNEIKNEEHAAYFYSLIGSGFQEQHHNGPEVDHWIIECDKDGKALMDKDSPLWLQYRARKSPTMAGTGSFSQFKEPEPQEEK